LINVKDDTAMTDKHAHTAQKSPAERAAEKQRSRDADERAVASGVKSREDLRLENSHFREIAHKPILWNKTQL
jgi:hypothetical protein